MSRISSAFKTNDLSELRTIFEELCRVPSCLRTKWLSDADVRAVEDRLVKWPGITKAALKREGPRIERVLDLVAQWIPCGNPPRAAARDDLIALEQNMRQGAAVLRRGTLMPVMPAILGRLAWKEQPALEFLSLLCPEKIEGACFAHSVSAAPLAALAQDLEHVADNAARLLASFPSGKGQHSLMDARRAFTPDLMCGAATVEIVSRLCGTRPKRPAPVLAKACQVIWEVTGGKDPKAPNWNYIIGSIVRAKPGSPEEDAAIKARIILLTS
jgi:hypothetical protein